MTSRTPRQRFLPWCLGLGIAVLAGSIAMTAPGDQVSAAAGTITGRTYHDFASNGVFDMAETPGVAQDIGVAGVLVRAFDSAGTKVGEATTGVDGAYALSVTGSASDQVRVEFEIPDSGNISAYESSFFGANSGTSIQFVSVGATNVDFATHVPGEYCQSNPYLAVSRLCAGAGAALNGAPTVFVTRYDGGPYDTSTALITGFTSWADNTAGTKLTTGSILGMAWDRSTEKIYNTAYVRRHSEMYEVAGKPVPGALFVTAPAGTKSGDPTGGSTSFLIDLEQLLAGDQFSNSNPAGPGYIPSNSDRMIERMPYGTGSVGDSGVDDDGIDSDYLGRVGVFEEVGATGIGDIETDQNGTLWVVSLYDRNLYAVTLPSNGSAPTQMASWGNIADAVTCTNGKARPFSVRLWRGSLYLGVVCDGSDDFNASSPLPATVPNTNVTFTVLKRDLNPQGSFTTFFGPSSLSNTGRITKGQPTGQGGNGAVESMTWNPWTNYYPTKGNTSAEARFNQRPTPLLSEIEFDRDGSMILGFRDRTGDQTSTNDSETPNGGRTAYPSIASGDVYRVCRVGPGYSGSDYVFEGDPSHPGCGQNLDSVNGNEYYFGDAYRYDAANWPVGHAEISAGMLKQVPGFPDLIVTGFDPFSGPNSGRTVFYSGGLRYMRNATGAGYALEEEDFPNVGGGVMFYSHVGQPLSVGGFQKVNGMSDVEALCDQAPVQIGNRVWLDPDKDGIQDPGELPVAGVTVRLYDSTGATLLGTAVTDAKGEYYFSSNVTEAAAGNGDREGGGLVAGSSYVIRFDNPADYVAGGPLAGYLLTLVNGTDVASTLDDAIDSDAITVASYPQIVTTTISPGVNDHTYDVGFYRDPAAPQAVERDPAAPQAVAPSSVIKVSVGDYVWWDLDRDGIQDASDIPIPGVVLTIKKADGSAVTDVNGKPVTTTVTDANGKYSFDNLAPGQYIVTVTPPEGGIATKAGAGKNRGKDSSTGSATSVVLTTDGQRDPTLDFGFYRPSAKVGNYVWRDVKGDGNQNISDKGLGGFTLTVRKFSGGAVTDVYGRVVGPVRSKADGKYLFEHLPAGRYVVKITYPRGYMPTTADRPDPKTNSSTELALSRALKAGQSDLTLDFGVVSRPGERFKALPSTF